MTEFLLTANECSAKAESPIAAVAQLFLTCANLDFELQAVISKMTRLVFCTQHQNLMFGLEWNCQSVWGWKVSGLYQNLCRVCSEQSTYKYKYKYIMLQEQMIGDHY